MHLRSAIKRDNFMHEVQRNDGTDKTALLEFFTMIVSHARLSKHQEIALHKVEIKRALRIAGENSQIFRISAS